jgi:NTE family protein
MLAFVLSGGGSRGALQVGALKALMEAGIQPDMVIGTSIGAVNSVFFAADPTLQGVMKLKQLYEIIMPDDVLPGGNKVAALNLVMQLPHLFSNDRLQLLLEEHLPLQIFGELKIPCYVVATDMDTGENRVFGDHPDDRLIDSLMSSTAMTPLLPSWEVEGRVYADGGLGAMLPVLEAVERGATELIALNLTAQLQTPEERKTLIDTLTHVIDLLLQSQVFSQVEAVKRDDQVALDVIDLNTEQYQNMRYGDNLIETVEYGYNLMRETIEHSHQETEVLSKRLYRRWRKVTPASQAEAAIPVVGDPVRSRQTSLARRAAYSVRLYRHTAWMVMRRGPVIMMQLPLKLPGMGLMWRGGKRVTGLIQNYKLFRSIVRSVSHLAAARSLIQ